MVAVGFPGDAVALLAAVVVLLAAAALFALAETSLVRISRAKALALQDEHRRGAAQLVRLVEDPNQFLNGVLLLVLVSQLVVATVVGILSEHWFGAWGVVAATVFEVVVIFVLGEALPKNWAVRNPERAALLTAPPVSAVVRLWPIRIVSAALVGLADALSGPRRRPGQVSESELLAMADVAAEDQVIEREERALIHSIIDFGDTVVREVMVPRRDMRATEAAVAVSDALGEAMDAGFSRIPIYEGNLDDIVGVGYVKDLVRAERGGQGASAVRDLARPARFVPETKRVAGLMREMQAQKYHMALVVDEYGGTAGLVTLEDLIEELVGEIVDEFDVEEPPVRVLGPSAWSVSPRLAVDELEDLIGSRLPEGSWDSVGGFLIGTLGSVPADGEAISVGEWRFEAHGVERNRIGRVVVRRGDDLGDASRTESPALPDPDPGTAG